MTLYDLYLMLEKRGVVDFQVTSHDVDRPADVKAGNAADCLDVKHTSYSVYKPNPVQQKNVKSSNLGGFLNYTTLENSKYLQLIWRILTTEKDICVNISFMWYHFEVFLSMR
jgi:hypothetical protein